MKSDIELVYEGNLPEPKYMNSRSSHHSLLGLKLFTFTGQELLDLDLDYGIEYVFDEDHQVKLIEDYYDTIEKNDLDKKYICFEVSTTERILSIDIAELGYIEFFSYLDFKFIKNFETNTYGSQEFNHDIFLVVNVYYSSFYDHYSGCDEYDIEMNIVGYLNAEKELVKI